MKKWRYFIEILDLHKYVLKKYYLRWTLLQTKNIEVHFQFVFGTTAFCSIFYLNVDTNAQSGNIWHLIFLAQNSYYTEL